MAVRHWRSFVNTSSNKLDLLETLCLYIPALKDEAFQAPLVSATFECSGKASSGGWVGRLDMEHPGANAQTQLDQQMDLFAISSGCACVVLMLHDTIASRRELKTKLSANKTTTTQP